MIKTKILLIVLCTFALIFNSYSMQYDANNFEADRKRIENLKAKLISTNERICVMDDGHTEKAQLIQYAQNLNIIIANLEDIERAALTQYQEKNRNKRKRTEFE